MHSGGMEAWGHDIEVWPDPENPVTQRLISAVTNDERKGKTKTTPASDGCGLHEKL